MQTTDIVLQAIEAVPICIIGATARLALAKRANSMDMLRIWVGGIILGTGGYMIAIRAPIAYAPMLAAAAAFICAIAAPTAFRVIDGSPAKIARVVIRQPVNEEQPYDQ
jgi:hypothetical protein